MKSYMRFLSLLTVTSLAACEPAGDQVGGLAVAEAGSEVLGNPGHEDMNQTAPDVFDVLFHTTAGDFTLRVTRAWAPIGADRFYSLVVNGYYDGNRFFRIVPGFVVQWGLHGDADVNRSWLGSDQAKIQDDPIVEFNTRGRITFANSGPNTRTTQLFINYRDNPPLDDPIRMRGSVFAPFGEVIGDGMQVVDAINAQYSEAPQQGRIQQEGNVYLDEDFPELDYIISATVVE